MSTTAPPRRSKPRTAPPARAEVRYRVLSSPDGQFYFAMAEGSLLETGWLSMRDALPKSWRLDERLEPKLAGALKDALAGLEADFSAWKVPSAAPFTAACRKVVRRIPRGTTISYRELAKRAGNPAAARAAGQAMRTNPTPIVVPCHRVVASDGGLRGFGGASVQGCPQLDLKAKLLARERRGNAGD